MNNEQLRLAAYRVNQKKQSILDFKIQMMVEVLMPSLESKNGKYVTLWGLKSFEELKRMMKAILLSEE